VPDVLAPGLRIVFVGINPGRVSAAARAHFANPRNDFWRLLHASRLTSRLYEPQEQFALLDEGIGITNAAYRTTPGSGDLRSADFVGSADRLDRIARELRPGWLAFVGKEAYRGAFGARPDFGLQDKQLHDTRLFVLPSTSPANAAVPWSERLSWFRELAGRESGLPERTAIRALLVDDDGRVLLFRYGDDYGSWWIAPGGGQEAGEDDAQTIGRELREECGLTGVVPGPLLAEWRHWGTEELGFGSGVSRMYLVRVPSFELAPELDLRDEGCLEERWFEPEEIAALPTRPANLAEIVSRASGS
jgi:TDG/mug DNA glycosylase family protein